MRRGMSNRKRLKKLILANKETKCLYRMMQFLAIFMIVSCLVVVTTAKWIEYDQNKKREELFGSWDEVFLNVDQDDLNYFRKNAFLEQISVQSIQEKVFLEGDQRVVIGSCDENFLEMGNIELLEGRMPEQKKEVAVEEEYLGILGVSGVGDVVPNDSEAESLRGYKVIGIVDNYSRRWKLINNNVKYINCFVSNETNQEINVLIKYKKWSSYDQEVNMINYERNIHKLSIDVFWEIVMYIIILGLSELFMIIGVLSFLCQKMIKIELNILKENNILSIFDKLLKNRKLLKIIENISAVVISILIYEIYISFFQGCSSIFISSEGTYLDIVTSTNVRDMIYALINVDCNIAKINVYFNVFRIMDALWMIIFIIILVSVMAFIKMTRIILDINGQRQRMILSKYFWNETFAVKMKNKTISSYMILSLFTFILIDIFINYRFVLRKSLFISLINYFMITFILFSIFDFILEKYLKGRVRYLLQDYDL